MKFFTVAMIKEKCKVITKDNNVIFLKITLASYHYQLGILSSPLAARV